MMKIIKKDITTCTSGLLLNGVNCQKKMGSGVALAYLRKWPIVREQYLVTEPSLGNTDFVTIVDEKLYVANCYSQEFFGSDGKRYASLEALESSARLAFEFAWTMGIDVYTPQIGCGLGGLDWDTEVGPIMEELHKEFQVETFVCLI